MASEFVVDRGRHVSNLNTENADLSTTLRSGRDDKFVCTRRIVISTGGVMGLRPTQGDEKRLGPATTFYGTVALSFVIPSDHRPAAHL
jgi:hypothetical protein